MIAYYILYDHRQNKFYYIQVWEVYSALMKKYHGKPLPSTFTINFQYQLDGQALSEMFETNLKNGI